MVRLACGFIAKQILLEREQALAAAVPSRIPYQAAILIVALRIYGEQRVNQRQVAKALWQVTEEVTAIHINHLA